MKCFCYILLSFGVLFQNPKIVCGNMSWLMLEKSGTSHFTKANLTYLQRLSRLSPEVQTYIAKFTDPMDGKGTLVKFLDDCDDDFVRYLNDPENALQVCGFLAHKPGVLDAGDQDLIARMLYDPSEIGPKSPKMAGVW